LQGTSGSMWPSDSSGRICGNDVEPDASEIVFLSCEGNCSAVSKVLVALSQGKRMEHSSHHLHPEFGLLSPTPRLRRELRVAASSLLFGGIAGALCVSGVIALRHSDRAAMEIAEAPTATAFQDAASHEGEPRSGPSADARATSPESHTGTAARPPASADVSAQRSSDPSEPAVAPAPAIAPKPRMVRIRKAIDSPAIARLPLGRSAPAAAAPPADTSESTQASNAAPAGSDVPAATPEKAGVRSGTREAVANSSPPKKKVQKTVRTASSRRDDIESDSFWRGERTDDWSTRPAAPASADVPGATPEKAVTRMGAREGLVDSSPPKTVRNASSRRNDTGNDSFWRDERTDDRAAAANDARNPVGRANAREAASSFRGFWDWSR
jgi:hypothetical protein